MNLINYQIFYVKEWHVVLSQDCTLYLFILYHHVSKNLHGYISQAMIFMEKTKKVSQQTWWSRPSEVQDLLCGYSHKERTQANKPKNLTVPAPAPRHTPSPSIPNPSRNSSLKGHAPVLILFNGFFMSDFSLERKVKWMGNLWGEKNTSLPESEFSAYITYFYFKFSNG